MNFMGKLIFYNISSFIKDGQAVYHDSNCSTFSKTK